MPKRGSLDALDFAVSSIKDFNKKLEDDILKIADETAKKILAEIILTAPVSKKNDLHLRDSFKIKITKALGEVLVQIYSPKKGKLIHLLEYGAPNNNMSAHPFLRKAFDKYIGDFVNKIQKRIKGGV